MKHLETFESAAKYLGIDPTTLPIVDHLPTWSQKSTIAAYKLFVISKSSWEGKKVDWNDYSQYKFYPLFDMKTYDNSVDSSAGFSFDVVGCVNVVSGVGSRLVYPSREIAEYVGKTHLQLYRDLMVIESEISNG